MSLSPVPSGISVNSPQMNPPANLQLSNPVNQPSSRYTYLPSSILVKVMFLLPQSLTDCVLVNKHWKIATGTASNAYIKSIKRQGPYDIFGSNEWQQAFNLTNPPFAPPIPIDYITNLYSNPAINFKTIMLIPDIIEINNVKFELTPDLLKKIGFVFDLVISEPGIVQGIQKKISLSSKAISRPNGAYWVAYKVGGRFNIAANSNWVTGVTGQGYKPHIWDVVNIAFQRNLLGLPLDQSVNANYTLKPAKNSGNPNIEFFGDNSNFFKSLRDAFTDKDDDFPFFNSLITRRSKPIATPALPLIYSPSEPSSRLEPNSIMFSDPLLTPISPVSNLIPSSTSSIVPNSNATNSNNLNKSFLTSKFFITFLKIGDFIPGISIGTNIYTLFRKRAYKKAGRNYNLNLKTTRNYAYFKNKSSMRCIFLMIPGLNIIIATHHLCKRYKKS